MAEYLLSAETLAVIPDSFIREYQSLVIGQLIFKEIQAAVLVVTRRYSPRLYADGATNWDDALEDLVQQVTVDRLLGQGQLDYAIRFAADLEHFRHLLQRQVRHTLLVRRERNVVDNLIERAKTILDASGYVQHGVGTARRYGLPRRVVELRDPSPEELRAAATFIAAIPQRRGDPHERAPVVYDQTALTALLLRFATVLPCAFTLRNLDDALRLVLTPWLLGDLVSPDAGESVAAPGLTPEELSEVQATAMAIISELSSEDLRILGMKLANVPDREIADAMGVSRPTLATKKHKVLHVVGSHLEDASSAIREEVIDELSLRLAPIGSPP